MSSALMGQVLEKRPADEVAYHTMGFLATQVQIDEPGIDTGLALVDFIARWVELGSTTRAGDRGPVMALEKHPRFRALEEDTEEVSVAGATCARTRAVLEERDNPQFGATALHMPMDALLCIHPVLPDVYVYVAVSERYFAGKRTNAERMDQIFEKGRSALDTIQFK